ncbi:Spo0B domain-containing protein [Bacillus sp. FJAT-22090]|uniref:Spo0B domain-containing protein n=1 Tax=Bacillus sp. FJAT-22090 TaxID=1581038 RepID=UPI0011A0DBBD|nr:Spo0B domain-containing protein [Bacillus sp. FJAT-22090]
MDEKEITVNMVLRHSMHDFLNNLHLIQMNLDMGKNDEAKNLIRTYSLKCNQFFDLNNAGLYKTNEWLQTFSMRYNKMTLVVQTSLLRSGAEKYDAVLRDYLDHILQSIYPNLRGYQEQLFKVQIKTEGILEIQIDIQGDWSPVSSKLGTSSELFHIEKQLSTETELKVKLIASERLE